MYDDVAEAELILDVLYLIVRFNVAVFKHPEAFNEVYVYTPLEVYIAPLDVHVNELQAVCDKVDVELLLTTRFNVAVFTHPEEFNEVYVYVPLVVYVTPLDVHVYELQAVCDNDDIVLLITSCKYVVSEPHVPVAISRTV